MKLPFNLKDLFSRKGEEQAPSAEETNDAAIAAIILRKSDEAALAPKFAEQGYLVDDRMESEDGEHVVFKQTDFEAEDVVAFKMNDEIAVLVTGVKKQFSPFLDSMSFGENFSAQGFMPSVALGAEAMLDTVRTVLRSSDDAKAAKGKIGTVMKDFSEFVVTLLDGLPEVAFKMEELSQIVTEKAAPKADVDDDAEKEAAKKAEAEETAKKAEAEEAAKKAEADAAAAAGGSDEVTDTDPGDGDDDEAAVKLAEEEAAKKAAEEEAAATADAELTDDDYDYEDPGYKAALADLETIRKSGVRMLDLGSVMRPTPPLKKKAAEAKETTEITKKDEGDDAAAATSDDATGTDDKEDKILKAIAGLKDEITEARKETQALGKRVDDVDSKAKKAEEAVHGTVLSGSAIQDNTFGTRNPDTVQKSGGVWDGSALDRVVG